MEPTLLLFPTTVVTVGLRPLVPELGILPDEDVLIPTVMELVD
jgi:hypothetical protein